MKHDFYINGTGSSCFGIRLLSNYKVGATQIRRSRHKPASCVQGWTPLATEYDLRTITLPVLVSGRHARQAAERKSEFDAELLSDPVELKLPNGMTYIASLNSCSEVEEMQLDGSALKCTYTLVGYARDPLVRLTAAPGGQVYIDGTAPAMACRLTCTAGADAIAYEMCGVIFSNVAAGDVLMLDGIERRVLRNGVNDFGGCDLITWPTLSPGYNTMTAPDDIVVEYFPIWV